MVKDITFTTKELRELACKAGCNMHVHWLDTLTDHYQIDLSNQQLIQWIFTAPTDITNILEQWYDTLLEHNFSLIYEFEERLVEWLERQNLYVSVFPSKGEWVYSIYELDKVNYAYTGYTSPYSSRHVAKTEGLKKAITLIKES